MTKSKTIQVEYEKRTYHFLKSQCSDLDELEKEWNEVMGPGAFNVRNVDIARIAVSAGIELIKATIAEARRNYNEEPMRQLWRVGIYNLKPEKERKGKRDRTR
jgi:hypothetical protein